MKLRTRLDLFSAALLSALGATPLVACAGAVTGGGAATGGAASGGSGSASTGGASTGGASTASSGQSGAATAGALGSAGANKYPCQNPTDASFGFVGCDSFVHRQAVVACPSQVPRPAPLSNPAPLASCTVDTDCTAKPFGWCGTGLAMGVPYTTCNYGCVNDSDCGNNQLCECSEPVGYCVSALCTSDADCTPGFFCKRYDGSPGCGSTWYSCQSPTDTCGSDLECKPDGRNHCNFVRETQSFQCLSASCSIGRPFLTEGVARLAKGASRADWSELALLPRLTPLDEALSTRLAERWTRIALMEHASIAAFARFTLQLLSLGAPASLIERATAAMIDETKHAKACFAVASAYASAPLGPGRLAVERSLDESSLVEIVLSAIREGCVGETVAAIEAREAAEHASDPALRELLLRISEDETRHAELAYQFVKWALSLGGAELERAVRAEFALLARAEPPDLRGLPQGDSDLLRHGIVPEALRQAIRGQAIAEVILPCSRALFSTRVRPPRERHSSV